MPGRTTGHARFASVTVFASAAANSIRPVREVRIKDTLSGGLVTLDPGLEVGIYACGPTVYDRIHIGNARPFVVFSLLARFLRSEGYEVRLVINITDVNDKIYDAAHAGGQDSADLARAMSEAYVEDTDRLGLGRPDSEPLATETIAPIVALIEELIEAGHAYESGGDVYFRVRSFAAYGKLSNRRPEEMDQGEEAGSESLKEDRLDFALWKGHKPGEDTSWDSPWGRGRPGWHIECSAMAEAELGPSFAIHGGGSDLLFPHHENEIAQSEGAGRPFARLWMHNGMVEADAEKMSKSEGNIFQLSEALDRFGGEAVIAYILSGHYRQPLAFSEEALNEALARAERLRNFLRERPPERGRARMRLPGWSVSATPSPTTSTRPGRWPKPSIWSPPRTGGRRSRGPGPRWRRCSRRSASTRWPGRTPRRWGPTCRRFSPSARRRARRAISSARIGFASSSRSSAGRSATRPRARG